MNPETIKAAAVALELEVQKAKDAGYENADCVFTAEVRRLLLLAKSGEIKEPVRLEFTAGPAWNFFETKLGECRALEEAWAKFRAEVEDWNARPAFRALKQMMNEDHE
jgi:hypothetical protein